MSAISRFIHPPRHNFSHLRASALEHLHKSEEKKVRADEITAEAETSGDQNHFGRDLEDAFKLKEERNR